MTRLTVDNLRSLCVDAKGEHASDARQIRGVPVQQVVQAKRHADRPPMQALADILVEGGAGGPDAEAVQNRRRGFLRKKLDVGGQGNQDAQVKWRDWLQRAAARPVEDVLQFQIQVATLPDRPQLCAITTEAFLLAAKLVLVDDTFKDAYGVCDASFKINKANWALFMLGLSAKHHTERQRWCSQLILLGLAWVPKEDGECLKEVLKTIRDWYCARKIDLNFHLQEASVTC